MTDPRPVVIVGLPRSGTTWTLRALATAPETLAVLEPDNEDKHPAAIHAKRSLGRYPVLGPGDAAPSYRDLWTWIMSGAPEERRSRLARHLLGPGAVDRIHEGRRDPVTWLAGQVARSPRPGFPDGHRRVVAKSIHAELAVEWLAAEFDIDVVVLLRHPANVLASWLETRLKDARNSTLESRPEIRTRYLAPWGTPLPGPDPVERVSWRIGLLTAALEEAAARHPEWHLRTHEHLCRDPSDEFHRLFDDLGLVWGDPSVRFLHDHDAPGSGFAINRVATDLTDSWRRRLDGSQLATLRQTLAKFPITTWTDRDFRFNGD